MEYAWLIGPKREERERDAQTKVNCPLSSLVGVTDLSSFPPGSEMRCQCTHPTYVPKTSEVQTFQNYRGI